MKLTALSIVVTLSSVSAAAQAASPNPYCVAGLDWRPGKGMIGLDMPGGIDDPSGSLCYNWGYDNSFNGVLAMVNPDWRWTHFERTPPPHSYNVEKQSITDAEWLRDFVKKNPGRVWMIGNEPDNPQLDAGDGMTPVTYAQMFHAYHAFIHPIDPTAKFAIGALYAASEPGEADQDFKWWNEVLSYYRKEYGQDMPIDIWTNHCYSVVGRLDPDRIMEAFFIPWRHYVDTVSGGIYEDRPIWCTEFGVAMWANTLHPDYMAEFVHQLCPRFERDYKLPSGKTKRVLDRWFWFLGYYSSGLWQDSALVTKQSEPTAVGRAYSHLANNYPNPLPADPAEPSAPPDVVQSDFGISAEPWRPLAGDWMRDEGAYRQSRTESKPFNLQAHLPYRYRDGSIQFDVKINGSEEPNHWAGASLRHGTVWKGRLDGYLVFLRRNGEVGLAVTGQKEPVAKVENVVTDTSKYHRFHVSFEGPNIQVRVDDRFIFQWSDPNEKFEAGLVSLIAGKTDASFDNVEVRAGR